MQMLSQRQMGGQTGGVISENTPIEHIRRVDRSKLLLIQDGILGRLQDLGCGLCGNLDLLSAHNQERWLYFFRYQDHPLLDLLRVVGYIWCPACGEETQFVFTGHVTRDITYSLSTATKMLEDPGLTLLSTNEWPWVEQEIAVPGLGIPETT